MKILAVVMAVLLCDVAVAQQQNEAPYSKALGIKISSGAAVSYKSFINSKNAFEAQAAFFNQGTRLVALYEFHFFTFESVPGLGWYVGPGAHIGFWKRNFRDKYNSTVDIGIDGVIGLDYKIPQVPINLSLDWQPSFSLVGNAGLSPQYGGIAIRYILNN